MGTAGLARRWRRRGNLAHSGAPPSRRRGRRDGTALGSAVTTITLGRGANRGRGHSGLGAALGRAEPQPALLIQQRGTDLPKHFQI